MSAATQTTHGTRVPQGHVLLVASFGAFLAFLDATIVNVAFPSMRASFTGQSVSTLSWILNAYNIVFAACLIVCGRMTDLLGRRRMFVAGVVIFTVASVLCGLAPSVWVLVGFRVIQAVGAAMLVPASLGLVIAAFPTERRAHAISLWGAAAAVAAGLGPPIGGALVELGSWRWAFLINLPLGLLAIALARPRLVESRAPGRRELPDLVGATLSVAGVGVLNLAIVKGSDWGWTSPAVIGSLAAGVVLLGLFVASSRRARVPMIDRALLALPSFTVSSAATTLAGLGFYAYLLTNVLWLQYVWGYSVLFAGLALVPGALVAAIVAARLGPLADRHGYRWFVAPGALIWAGAYLWYHQRVGLEPAFLREWLPGQILSGIGVGATLPLLGSAGLASVPGGRYATASAVLSATRQLGGVLGIAILVVILGEPTPQTVVGTLRDGWLLSVAAFLATAMIALLLSRAHAQPDGELADAGRPPRVEAPLPSERPTRLPTVHHAHPASSIPLVQVLPATARAQLEEASEVIRLLAGEVLMRAGDPADAAYLVRTGRLVVEIDGENVREVGHGELLGELALLTDEPRSATIRARRDSTLLRIPRAAFLACVTDSAQASRVVLTQLAMRLQTVRSGGPSTPSSRTVSIIAVIGTGPGAPVLDVADRLNARLATHLRVARLDAGTLDAIVRAESENDRVLLVSSAHHPAGWEEFCRRHADAVVLVGRSDAAVAPMSPPPPGGHVELVLVGPRPTPARCAQWVAAVDAWQLTAVDDGIDAGVRPLADRLAGRSLGVVIAGGGARAFAGIGLLRELEDNGIVVDRVVGASMGGLVATSHAMGWDGAELEDRAYGEFVRRRPFADYGVPTTSLVRGDRILRDLRREFGEETVIEGLPRQLAVVSTDLVSRTRVVHRRGSVVSAASATSRIPVILPPMATPDGQLLVDGGVLDNMPTDLLVEHDEGPVIAMAVPSGERRGTAATPRIPALPDTLMRTLMISSGGGIDRARTLGAWVVTPSSLGVGLLEFHQFDRMVQAGRDAARALLEETGGDFRRR